MAHPLNPILEGKGQVQSGKKSDDMLKTGKRPGVSFKPGEQEKTKAKTKTNKKTTST